MEQASRAFLLVCICMQGYLKKFQTQHEDQVLPEDYQRITYFSYAATEKPCHGQENQIKELHRELLDQCDKHLILSCAPKGLTDGWSN